MPYVAPGSTIRLYHGVPLDNTYRHTTYKTSEAAQLSDLNSYYTPTVYTNYSYIRVTDGNDRIRIGLNTPAGSDIYTVNYCVFKNAAFENKNWFCFVLSVTYINNLTYELEIEVDVMQTFMRSYDLDYCLVDRCHTITDNIGDNVIPENLDMGYYKTAQVSDSGVFQNYYILCFVADTGTANIGQQQGIYNPINVYAFTEGGNNVNSPYNDLAEFLRTLTDNNRADTVIAIVYYPQSLYSTNATAESITVSSGLTSPTDYQPIDGYTPKNNKLETYPYTAMRVTNNNGSAVMLAFERFSSSPSFRIEGAMCCNPEVRCIPLAYEGDTYSYNNSLSITSFPQVAYIIDAYRAYVASGGETKNALSLIGSVASTIGGVAAMVAAPATGGLSAIAGAGMFANGALGIGNAINNELIASNLPPKTNGAVSGTAAFSNRHLEFNFEKRTISAQYARIIDDYFTQYGYACGQLMIPNRQARPYFTYIKTLQCNAHAISVPGEYMQHIVNIYNSGITFWDSLLHVGDYALDNRPTSASIAAAGLTTGGVNNG